MFARNDLIIELLDVYLFDRKPGILCTKNRPFHVLSRRLSGKTRLWYRDEEYAVNDDSLLYIPAHIDYRQEALTEERIVAIHFNILNFDTDSLSVLSCADKEVTDLFLRIHDVWNAQQPHYRYICTSLLYELLARFPPKAENFGESYDLIRMSVEYINRNYRDPLTIGELARMSGVCENYYRRLFCQCLGVSPLKYINRKRVSAAEALLASDYFTMGQIAERCGFAEEKYFCSVFKRETGKTPSEYARFARCSYNMATHNARP